MEIFKTYFGGKGGEGVYQTIINQIPPHKILIIPFLGNCAITRNIKPAHLTIGIDKNIDVISTWYTIVKSGDVGRQTSPQTKMGPGCIVKNGDSSSYRFLCRCGIEYLKTIRWDPLIKNADAGEVVIYIDAPYPLHTRTSKHRYKFELTDKQHIQLLKIVNKLPYNILISTYPNKIYSKLLKGWNVIKYKSPTRNGMRTELLYMNYENDGRLHDYRYLGRNFRERERIRKKILRWKKRLIKLPAKERNAILFEISHHQF